MTFYFRYIQLLLLLFPAVSSAQNFLPLDFSQNVQANNDIYPNNSSLGPYFFSGSTLDFVNVTTQDGMQVDARISIIGTSGNYNHVGYIPDYNSASGQPEGDLGIYYRHDGNFTEPTGGISYTLTFYEGGGAFANTVSLLDFRLLIYDHDGEPGQSESIVTHIDDGLAGYQLHNSSNITATYANGDVRFDSGGSNQPEDGPQGGFIAYYHNTSSIRFDMIATTFPSNPAQNNGIFAAIDGDLGLTGGQTGDFGTFVAVPEPGSCSLVACAISLGTLRRRRQGR